MFKTCLLIQNAVIIMLTKYRTRNQHLEPGIMTVKTMVKMVTMMLVVRIVRMVRLVTTVMVVMVTIANVIL